MVKGLWRCSFGDPSMMALPVTIEPPSVPTRDRQSTLTQLQAVSKDYASRSGETVTALKDVTLDVRENEFVTLVGPSGCGTSTVLKILGGIIRATKGIHLFNGKPLDRPSRQIGMVFQRPTL